MSEQVLEVFSNKIEGDYAWVPDIPGLGNLHKVYFNPYSYGDPYPNKGEHDQSLKEINESRCAKCAEEAAWREVQKVKPNAEIIEANLRTAGAFEIANRAAESSAAWRKDRPVATGVLDYFPDALLEVAYCSKIGNDQHNTGEPLHWAKEKSTDHADCVIRHLKDRGTFDSDGVRHSAKVAWRALALLQVELDAEKLKAQAGSERSSGV